MINNKDIAKRIDKGLQILKQEPSFIFNLEEVKAIEHFSNYPTNWNFCFEVDKRAIDTILGLISKLQKELEQEKEENKKLKKQSEISAKTHIKNDDLKDKAIDKMAKTIAGLQLYDFGRKEYFTLEDEGEVIEYFYKKVEEENE